MLIKQLYTINDDARALIELPDGSLYTFLMSPARKLAQQDLTQVGQAVDREIYLRSVHASPYEGAIEQLQMRAFGFTKSRVAALRHERGLSQQALADAAGMNIRQIQKVESGEYKVENITGKNLLGIADALGVDPRSLI